MPSLREVVTLSNGQSTGSTANKMLQSVHVFNNPVKFINYNSGQIDTDIQYYDDQGKLIDFSKSVLTFHQCLLMAVVMTIWIMG